MFSGTLNLAQSISALSVFIIRTLMYCNIVICYWNVTLLLYWSGKFRKPSECTVVHVLV